MATCQTLLLGILTGLLPGLSTDLLGLLDQVDFTEAVRLGTFGNLGPDALVWVVVGLQELGDEVVRTVEVHHIAKDDGNALSFHSSLDGTLIVGEEEVAQYFDADGLVLAVAFLGVFVVVVVIIIVSTVVVVVTLLLGQDTVEDVGRDVQVTRAADTEVLCTEHNLVERLEVLRNGTCVRVSNSIDLLPLRVVSVVDRVGVEEVVGNGVVHEYLGKQVFAPWREQITSEGGRQSVPCKVVRAKQSRRWSALGVAEGGVVSMVMVVLMLVTVVTAALKVRAVWTLAVVWLRQSEVASGVDLLQGARQGAVAWRVPEEALQNGRQRKDGCANDMEDTVAQLNVRVDECQIGRAHV